MRTSYALVLLPSLVGVALGGFAYFVPATGVNGTIGALLALLGAVAVALAAALAMMPAVRGGVLTLLDVLIALGAVLTALAAFFLMQYAFMVAMLLAALAVPVAIVTRPIRRHA